VGDLDDLRFFAQAVSDYRCTDEHASSLAWRERVAARPTACLIDEAAALGRQCQCT
jgi:hypothetical protein